MTERTSSCVIVALIVVLTCPLAGAQESAPRVAPPHSLRYQSVTVGRLNPLGFQSELKLGYRYRLYNSESVLWKGSFVGVALAPTINPAFARLGVQAEIQPIAVLRLSATAEWLAFFSSMGHLQSFPSPHAEWSDSRIDELEEAGTNYAGTGWHVTLTAVLRGKVGPVVVRDTLKALYSHMHVRAGDTVWYDPTPDIIRPATGWTITNDADVLVLIGDHWIVGVRHNLTHSFFPDDAFQPGEDTETSSTPHHRLGPLVAYKFFDEPGASFNKPTIALLLAWYLEHRNRTGHDTHVGVPYVALAFAFGGDLLVWD